MELYVNNIRVPFNGSISLKFANPLFNDIGSYSFPVTFPARVPVVQKAFGYPVNIESERPGYITARIKDGLLDLLGEWQISNVTDNTIEAYFKGGTGGFNQVAGPKLLTDLTYNGVTTPVLIPDTRENVLAYMTTLIDSVYPDTDYTAFCAYLPLAIGEDTLPDLQFVNPVSWTNNTLAFIVPDSGVLHSAVYLFVGAVIDYIFTEHNYKIEKNIFSEDPDLKQAVIFNTYNQNGHWEFNYQNFVPRKTVKEFLAKTKARFNVGFFIDEERRSVIIDKFDNVVRDLVITNLKLTLKKVDPRKPTGIKLTSELTDAFTDNQYTKISEFPGDYGTIYEVNNVRAILPGAGTLNRIYYVKNEEAYYVVKALPEWGYEAQRICTDQLPYITGDGSEPRDVAAGSTGMYNLRAPFTYQYQGNDHDDYADWLLPRCDLQCNFKSSLYDWLTRDPLNFIEFPIMFLFARGKQNVYMYTEANISDPEATPSFTINAPFGTISVYGPTGAKLYADLALTWNGEYGLVEKLWAKRLNWEMKDKKVVTADIIGNDYIKMLKYNKALRIENHNYLVNTFNIKITENNLWVTDAELFRL